MDLVAGLSFLDVFVSQNNVNWTRHRSWRNFWCVFLESYFLEICEYWMSVIQSPYLVVRTSLCKTFFRGCVFVLLNDSLTEPSTKSTLKATFHQLRPNFRHPRNGPNNRPQLPKHLTLEIPDTLLKMIIDNSFIKGHLIQLIFLLPIFIINHLKIILHLIHKRT